MKILLPFLLITALLLGGCTKEISLGKDSGNKVTKEEKAEIEEVAGETEVEQEIYVQTMNEVASDEDTLETLENELNETVILDEDFSDL